MSGLDIIIVIVFAYNIVLGVTKGFLKSLFGIASFVLATILAPLFQGIMVSLIQSYFNTPQELTKILGLGFSWFFVYTILSIVASIIIKGMNKTPLKILDRIAGVLVGL
ncbi:MAG: CvpA family protein, partial [Candidatus Sericytochromatia bacterium]|nr:CvpA family protein [Candidatus Sericytochromatia bacterium]